ncbi:thioredoxin-like fold domain-containing protein MRL7, chloroplastic [Silene latifolia]|uniref:thioredoxin-like fold domain-containing protein MRL7, chloroplastic n=1 Tax=Silene latifolia TaxID=37657 RepID=UPI003D788B89
MSIFMSNVVSRDCVSFSATKFINQTPQPYFSLLPGIPLSTLNSYSSWARSCLPTSTFIAWKGIRHVQHCVAAAHNSDADGESDSKSKPKTQGKGKSKKNNSPQTETNNVAEKQPTTIPRKPRRGRRSEAVAVEDFVRGSLEKTFASIREKNPDVFARKEQLFKKVREKAEHDDSDDEDDDDDDDDDDYDDNQTKKQMVVEDDDPDWPLDADVGWGIRASDYFEKNAIKNVVGDDGLEIDWEGELDNSWIREINSLEWETFAFHPSPLIVLVFERYNRPADNWKLLKELEKAFLVYWNAKDRLPPRAVKLDIKIERDLAYALKVKQCPQLLFLSGQRILYREKELRTADELVQMIAYFYYRAKKPSWIDDTALTRKS